MNQTPKLSVLMVTYNHERYIAQAVNSALAQRTNFPIEIIIGEDCSTDRTRQIVVDLAEANPQAIRLLLHERNLGGPLNVAAVFKACRGEYVAMLEGDDYWTDPLKLQKQVDALDAHPDWAICFHLTRMVFEDGSRPPSIYPANWSKDVATIDDLFYEDFMGTCSVVFRNHLFGPLPAWHSEITCGDWALHILNADHGRIGCLKEVLADYRVHSAGVWTRTTPAERHAQILRMFSRVDHHFQGKYSRQIDEYRIKLVTWFTHRVESLTSHVAHLEMVTQASAAQLKQTYENLTLLQQAHEGLVHAPSVPPPPPPPRQKPARPPRSAAYELSRTVMRPLERIGHRVGEAVGIRKKAG